MYKLDNPLRTYAWGSTTAIAELLGRIPSGGPEAELWIGSHPDSPSRILERGDIGITLTELISANPDSSLGAPTRAVFGDRLPFLMKVLAAASPLSLQVHPNLEQARAGYRAENESLVPQDAPHRNYRDAIHKPEMIFALTEFDALCGFRPASEASEVFRELVRLIEARNGRTPVILQSVIADLAITDEGRALEMAFTRLLAGETETRAAVEDIVAVLEETSPRPTATDIAHSSAETVLKLNSHYAGDPGVLVALLLNRVKLRPGQALYLPAGNIHAYLGGLGIEVMASSDNVLRGGLTPKHIDIDELLRVVEFASLELPLIKAESTSTGQEIYRPPFHEFQLQRIQFRASPREGATTSVVPLAQNGPAVVIAIDGSFLLEAPQGNLILHPGESAFVPANQSPVTVKCFSRTSNALAFAVTVGRHKR